ncbi:MAG: hypothetical protein AB2707_08550, partial [Candidatus Thiodiazotropha sp.]
MMQLSINPNTDEIPELGVNGNKNHKADLSSGSERRVVPIANKILLCSSDKAIEKRWQESLNEVGELAAVSSLESLIKSLKTCQTEVVLVDLE